MAEKRGTKTPGDGDKPYPNNEGVRPYGGQMSSQPNMPTVPEPTPSYQRDIHDVHMPNVGKHPTFGLNTNGDSEQKAINKDYSDDN
jgi:hypothetical protein